MCFSNNWAGPYNVQKPSFPSFLCKMKMAPLVSSRSQLAFPLRPEEFKTLGWVSAPRSLMSWAPGVAGFPAHCNAVPTLGGSLAFVCFIHPETPLPGAGPAPHSLLAQACPQTRSHLRPRWGHLGRVADL